MNKKKFTKLLALYLPYLVIGLAATNLGEAWRLAEGKELGDKIVSLMGTLPAAFANPLPSLHPLDILVGICCGAGLRLAVYRDAKRRDNEPLGVSVRTVVCNMILGLFNKIPILSAISTRVFLRFVTAYPLA